MAWVLIARLYFLNDTSVPSFISVYRENIKQGTNTTIELYIVSQVGIFKINYPIENDKSKGLKGFHAIIEKPQVEERNLRSSEQR
jgi:hypothetical protein